MPDSITGQKADTPHNRVVSSIDEKMKAYGGYNTGRGPDQAQGGKRPDADADIPSGLVEAGQLTKNPPKAGGDQAGGER